MVKTLACDECGSQDGVTRWRLGPMGGKSIVKDLCVLHGKPLVELLAGSGEAGTRADFQVTSLEEIEAKKSSVGRRDGQKYLP